MVLRSGVSERWFMKPYTTARFFRTVWRINGLAMLLLLAGALCYMMIGGVMLLNMGRREASDPVQVAVPQVAGEPTLRLSEFTQVGETGVVRAELVTEENGRSSYKGPGGEIRNVLFADTATGQSWWLLAKAGRRVASVVDLTENRLAAHETLAQIYQVVSKEGQAEVRELILADPTGRKQLSLAKGDVVLERCLSLGRDQARVLYRRGGAYHVITIDPVAITRISEIPVPVTYPAAP